MNTLKTGLLMAVLTALLVAIGQAVLGTKGALFFLIIALGMNLFSYYYSDKMTIAMTKSRPLSQEEAPDIHEIVERLAVKAGIPKPRVYLTPMAQPNAFATGRNPQHAAVAVTDGLMRLLNREEIEGVLAHEIAHIKNRDILVSTIAAALAGAITMIANVLQWGLIFGMGRGDDEGEGIGGLLGTLVMIIVAPLAAMLVQMAISRSREYLADAVGAHLSGNPDGLANALLKLEQAAHRIPSQVNPAASHMFIVHPLSAQSMANLFSTHPPIKDRVERLRKMRIGIS
ncbi:MAG: zinc metalloprotease HtpX [Peptococcaceae bacterium]|nr:zinc metalloprotease HtpX [Peptococcaceae bacterium]